MSTGGTKEKQEDSLNATHIQNQADWNLKKNGWICSEVHSFAYIASQYLDNF